MPWTPPHGKYEVPDDEPAVGLYKEKRWPRDAKIIAAMDTMIDGQVGRILDLLKELGIEERTIVFFCSDNGAAKRVDGVLDSSGPLRGAMRAMYEGGIRVPMIVRWPGRIKAGAISDLAWYFPDVLPTLAELAGAGEAVAKDIDGISIVPTLLGKGAQIRREYLYWEWPSYNWRKRAYDPKVLGQAVRAGDWKLLRHRRDKPWQLYNLASDVGERNRRGQGSSRGCGQDDVVGGQESRRTAARTDRAGKAQGEALPLRAMKARAKRGS